MTSHKTVIIINYINHLLLFKEHHPALNQWISGRKIKGRRGVGGGRYLETSPSKTTQESWEKN